MKKSVGIFLRPTIEKKAYQLVDTLLKWLNDNSVGVYFLEKEKARLKEIISAPVFSSLQFSEWRTIHKNIDFVISLGGDGTLLGACRLISSRLPLLGINIGKLGFITEFGRDDFMEGVKDVVSDTFSVVRKNIFQIKLYSGDKLFAEDLFINDAVWTKKSIARIFQMKVSGDEENIYQVSGDGLIVSTPLGSTAYSLAAGGPIVHPEVQSLVLTPICPHALTHRPLIVPDSLTIEGKLGSNSEDVILTLDGQKAYPVSKDDRVVITKMKNRHIKLIKNKNRNYFRTLKEKFTHGKQKH